MDWCWAVFYTLAFRLSVKFGNAQDISSSLQCKPPFHAEKIECQFTLYNNEDDAIFVSKWLTPLEGIKFSCLQVTRDGQNVPYDGMMTYRDFPPPSSSYVQIPPKRNMSASFDLSETYSANEPGKYTVSVDIWTLYVHTGVFEKENASTVHLQSPEVTFTITETVHRRRQTVGEIERRTREIRDTSRAWSPRGQGPLNPRFGKNFKNKTRERLITQLQRAVYHYVNISALEVMENEDHFKRWFGSNLTNRQVVRENYLKILRHLEQKAITYQSQSLICTLGLALAFTRKFSNRITLCDDVFDFKTLATNNDLHSVLSVMVHELAHSINGHHDIVYGKYKSAVLALKYPSKAILNADNYAYFTATTYPFNYGIDAMAVFPSGYTYIVKGNFYARLGKGKEEPFTLESNSYPELIDGNWGQLRDEFVNGFDTVFNCKDPSYTYVTKGPWYVRYTNNTLDYGYPKQIKHHFRNLWHKFKDRFDSAAHLPGASTYVSKGKHFIRFSDNECMFQSHAVTRIDRYWRHITRAFKHGFDSMMTTTSGKTFVTKGKQFIRFSDKLSRVMDHGYPKNIRDNFGKMKQ